MFRPKNELDTFAPLVAHERRRVLCALLDALATTHVTFLRAGG